MYDSDIGNVIGEVSFLTGQTSLLISHWTFALFEVNVIYRVRHKSVNRKCVTMYFTFNGFYKVISPAEIVQSDLHCYLDI
jgi:hypothetical protein